MATAITAWQDRIISDAPGCPLSIIDRAVLETCRDFCRQTKIWKKQLPGIDVIATSGSDIAFNDAAPATITTTAEDFDADGFASTDYIVTNSQYNPGPYLVDTVAANTITLDSGESLVDEDAASFTISKTMYPIAYAGGEIIRIEDASFETFHMDSVSEYYLDRDEPGWQQMTATTPERYFMGPGDELSLVYMPYDGSEQALKVKVSLVPLRTATTVEDFIYDKYLEIIADGARYEVLRPTNTPWANQKLSLEYYAKYQRGVKMSWNRIRNGFTNTPSGGFTG
jgi:hypothetical protein